MSKLFCLFAFLCAFSLTGAQAQYEKVILAPAEIRAASANAFYEGSYENDGQVIKWRVDFNKNSNKIFSITFKHPTGSGPQNQSMPPHEFWNGMGNCVMQDATTGTGNICIEQLVSQALMDCFNAILNMSGVSTHCWMR